MGTLGQDLQYVAVWACQAYYIQPSLSLWIHCGSMGSKQSITVIAVCHCRDDDELKETKHPVRKLKDVSRDQQRLSPVSESNQSSSLSN